MINVWKWMFVALVVGGFGSFVIGCCALLFIGAVGLHLRYSLTDKLANARDTVVDLAYYSLNSLSF